MKSDGMPEYILVGWHHLEYGLIQISGISHILTGLPNQSAVQLELCS